MDPKIKILVVGDVKGRFKQFIQKIDTVNKKAGPFEIVLCVGEFFGTKNQNDKLSAYKNGNLKIPVPVYILGPNTEHTAEYYNEINNGEIFNNLSYLGKRGVYTLSSGMKIAYLSGIEAPSDKLGNPKGEHLFTKDDVIALRSSCLVNKSYLSDYKGIDVLLTSQWPWGITDSNENTSKLISYLCTEIKPRYHFCGLLGKSLETPPFRIPADETTQLELCTRFIALADIGNKEKEKNVYALNVTPVDKMRVIDLIQKTTNEEPSPYLSIDFSACCTGLQNSDNKQYFFDLNSSGHQDNRKRMHGNGNQHNKRPKIQNIEQDKCWFCLSSPDVEKHLVISIGDKFYLALAKGPINEDHVLILSITHIRCAGLLPEADWEELNKFKTALRTFFKAKNKVVCFTERQYKTSHLQINVFAIDEGYSWKIEHAFEDKAEEFNIEFERIPPVTTTEILPDRGPYFVAELPDDVTLITRQMKHFPLHFARDVFCSENLLNCDEKVDWKNCTLSKEEEITLVSNFRKMFSKYDFTIK